MGRPRPPWLPRRLDPWILVFRLLTSRLTLFFLVWENVINHSKRNFVSSPLHRSDLSGHRWRGKLFIGEWPQDLHFVWRLKSGFSSDYSPSQLKIYWLKSTVIQGTIWIIFWGEIQLQNPTVKAPIVQK